MPRHHMVNNKKVPFTSEEEAAADAREAALEAERAAAIPLERIAAIKAEAGRRIVERYPLHQQANAQARASELLEIRLDRDWTTEETQEIAGLKAIRAWIKAIRDKSNELEQLDPLPEDCTADSYWVV
ncbi:MAG: hypothetical protein HQL70_09605 [Magnetococcales bacterium]|nr:hypothetical protein [Magnetococcales bacterium]